MSEMTVDPGHSDALAAEYVLGTLDFDERSQAQTLLGADENFAAKVRVWERRLGELHVMVEPVDPDWRVWERIKDKIGGFQSNPFYVAQSNKGVESEQAQDAPPTAPPELWDLDAPLSAPPEPGSIAADVPAEGPAAELPAAAEGAYSPTGSSVRSGISPESAIWALLTSRNLLARVVPLYWPEDTESRTS